MVSMRIELSERWLRFIQSPAMMLTAGLTCLSLAFGPVLLFMLGKAGAGYRDPRVIICFAAIVLIPLIYIRLAVLFIKQLRTGSDDSTSSVSRPSSGSMSSILLWVATVVGAFAIYSLLRP